MDKPTIVRTLNEEWKKFFCAHRLEWVTSSMNPVLFEYLEHLVFTDVHIEEQTNGLAVSPVSNYVFTVDIHSSLRGETHTSSIMTVDKDTNEEESWKHEGYYFEYDSYDGKGKIDGMDLYALLSLPYIEGKHLEFILVLFGLREKIENPLYRWFRLSESAKEQHLLTHFQEPITVNAITIENGEAKLILSNGIVLTGVQVIYKYQQSLL